MAIVSAKEILQKASQEAYAVGAFNITNIVQMEAVVEAAEELNAPLILQTSVTPSRLLKPKVLVAVYRTLADKASIPICLHLDHCTEVEYCKVCIDAGYTSIMIDASKQNFAENIRQTSEVCRYAHRFDAITVEGELGTVSGVEDQIKVVENEVLLCDPLSAGEFVERTGVDIFAPALGTAHGIYKTADPRVDFDRLERIRNALDAQGLQVPLVIHGGTGLPKQTVRRLIELGGAKFNVSTELKHVLIDTSFQYIHDHRDEYNPGNVDKAIQAAIKKTIQDWIALLGCSGKA